MFTQLDHEEQQEIDAEQFDLLGANRYFVPPQCGGFESSRDSKAMSPPLSTDECVDFANDPRHEEGLYFDGRPLRNLEMLALIIGIRNDPVLLANRWIQDFKRFLERENYVNSSS